MLEDRIYEKKANQKKRLQNTTQREAERKLPVVFAAASGVIILPFVLLIPSGA